MPVTYFFVSLEPVILTDKSKMKLLHRSIQANSCTRTAREFLAPSLQEILRLTSVVQDNLRLRKRQQPDLAQRRVQPLGLLRKPACKSLARFLVCHEGRSATKDAFRGGRVVRNVGQRLGQTVEVECIEEHQRRDWEANHGPDGEAGPAETVHEARRRGVCGERGSFKRHDGCQQPPRLATTQQK